MTGSFRLRKMEAALAVAGVCLALYGAGHLLQGWAFEKQAHLYAASGEGPHAASSRLLSSVARLLTPESVHVLGRLSIPRLHTSVLVVEGDDDLSLRLGVGHVPGTSMPGQTGNVALAAHRDTYFRELRNIRGGDRVVLTTREGTMAYTIKQSRIVDPGDVSVLKPGSGPQLTLITCYPFGYVGEAPLRFVVTGSIEKPEAVKKDVRHRKAKKRGRNDTQAVNS